MKKYSCPFILFIIIFIFFLLFFRKFRIDSNCKIDVSVYSGYSVKYNYEYINKFRDKKLIDDWLNFNKKKKYRLTFSNEIPDLVLTFCNGQTIIIFSKKFVLCYQKNSHCISYYIRNIEENDRLFVDRLRLIKND